MANVTVKTVNDLAEYTALVEKLQKKAKGELWFRGCSHFRSHKLVPSVYRHPKKKSTTDRAALEAKVTQYFRQRSIPFGAPVSGGAWDFLFYMQHYGIPTRLLDWSQSPFIGLYFAVADAGSKTPGRRPDAAVWILDPTAWNRCALRDIQYQENVLSVDDEELRGYAYVTGYTGMKTYPVALFGNHNSRRIVAQRGVFTVFGQGSQPMETAYDKGDFPKDCLVKIRIPGKKTKDLQDSLERAGITASVVFPDLEGFARELKRCFGFEV